MTASPPKCQPISIVERLRFDATRCELQFSKGVAGNIREAADEIASLRAKVDELTEALRDARAHIAGANLAAGTAAYTRCCRALMAIDKALAIHSQHSDGEAGR